jgi:hypothetical protein
MTYKLKIHNPWQLALVLLLSLFSPTLLLHKYGEGICVAVGIVCMFGSMTLAYKFLGRVINIELTENGVNTTWTKGLFCNYYNENIEWGDILYWDLQSSKWMDAFSIKTRDGQTLYIRCMDLYSRQQQLDSFTDTFKMKVDRFNKYSITANNKIQVAPSLYEKPIGQVFAVLVFIGLIFLTYKIQTQGIGSTPTYKIAFVYIMGIFWIGMTISFYLIKKFRK